MRECEFDFKDKYFIIKLIYASDNIGNIGTIGR